MCEYCNLLSGESKEIEEYSELGLYLERHANTYSLVATCNLYDIEKEIKHCPMCGRKLGG